MARAAARARTAASSAEVRSHEFEENADGRSWVWKHGGGSACAIHLAHDTHTQTHNVSLRSATPSGPPSTRGRPSPRTCSKFGRTPSAPASPDVSIGAVPISSNAPAAACDGSATLPLHCAADDVDRRTPPPTRRVLEMPSDVGDVVRPTTASMAPCTPCGGGGGAVDACHAGWRQVPVRSKARPTFGLRAVRDRSSGPSRTAASGAFATATASAPERGGRRSAGRFKPGRSQAEYWAASLP